MIIKLKEKYQIAIPKKLIKKLKLKTGDNIHVHIEKSKIIIEPIDESFYWNNPWQEKMQTENYIENEKTNNLNSTQKLFETLED